MGKELSFVKSATVFKEIIEISRQLSLDPMWAYKRLFGRESVDVLPSRNSTSGSWQDETDNADKDVMITDDKDEDSRLVERKTKLEGVVTKLDRIDSVGVISNCYRFGAEQFLTDLAKGTVVTFNAERNRGCAIWTATDIKIKGGSREWAGDDGRKTRLQRTIWADYRVLDILQDKIIVGLDPDCESGVGRSCHKIRVEIRKELLPKEYPVVLGDWLHLRFKGGEGDDIATAELISVDFTEIIFKTGTINMTRGHLCVDGSIYFTNDLIEDGAKPCVGDTARVTAVASDQVQLTALKHVRSPEQTPAIIRENVFMELIQDKNKIRILPKGTISFKTKILGSTSLEVVTIENNGESRFILRRIFMGRIQDVAKFDFVFQKGFLNPEDLFIELQPHRSWAFTIKCTPIHLGRTKELLLFDFGSFKIGRWLYVFSLAPNQDEILHCKPVILNKIRRKVTKELIDNLIIEKNMLVVSAPSHVRAPFFVPHKIGASKVPTGVLECFRAKNQSLLLELYPSVVQELYSGNYVNQFKRSDWENYYCIKVPGLKEFHPPVWTGDLVRVYESLNSTEMFEGPIKKIILEDADVPSIVVQLPEKFNFTYDGSPRVIQFTLGRVPYKRMHFAVEQAFKYLGPDWLFPTNLILEEPRIDYIEDESDNLHPAIQKQVMQGKSNGSGSSIKVKLINDTGRQRNLKPFQGNITEPTSLDKELVKPLLWWKPFCRFTLWSQPQESCHVFIDEAGYCTEPETMIPCVLAAIDKQSQVILVGDPEQLGPVLMCDIAFNKEAN
ncbi:unnamed protein product [Allacma fusca]|uniref:DNA2/NAM7 helicase helicase domain-containing protein n=1 Tax=Allacma fusca TaxID=39272 RepID=A0A8J2L8G4_9HEXA|nr:unnamed protein product [Allacma fusca]